MRAPATTRPRAEPLCAEPKHAGPGLAPGPLLMTEIEHKIKNALNEARILVLVGQVILTFQCQEVFRPSWKELTPAMHGVKIAAITLVLLTLGILLSPASEHALVERGECTEDFHRRLSRRVTPTLSLLAAVLGLELFFSCARIVGTGAAAAVGAAAFAVCVGLWYAYPLLHGHRH